MPFIDWTPFFHTRELRGFIRRFSSTRNTVRKRPSCLPTRKELLGEFVANKSLELRAVYGLFPANRVGDDVEVYTNGSRQHLRTKLHFLRQQIEKGDGTPNYCLADFIAPKGVPDYIGGFAVTSGHGLKDIVEKFKVAHDDYNAIMAEAIADRGGKHSRSICTNVSVMNGALANRKNSRPPIIEENIAASARRLGIPPARIASKAILWDLLDVEQHRHQAHRSFAMWPGSSVVGFISRTDSKYFAVGKLGKDQVADHAAAQR